MPVSGSSMELRQAGDSGLKLSVIGLGCASLGGGEFWGPTDQKTADKIVQSAFDLGVNYFDTAEAYNEGRSEESLGVALKEIPRDRVIIGSKISPVNAYPGQLTRHCEKSLQRLDTDYIDIYMIHWPPSPFAIRYFTRDEELIARPPLIEDVISEMEQLKENGKIRYISVSNFGTPWLERAKSEGFTPLTNQLPYNLLFRAAEVELFQYCRNAGIGVIGYSPLMQGLLTGYYPTFNDVPEMQRRSRHFNSERSMVRHGEEGAELETAFALKEIRAIADELSMTPGMIAIKWALYNPVITSIIPGMRTDAKVIENVFASYVKLPDDVVIRLNEVTRPLKERLGPSLDMWESSENDRTI